MIKQITKQMMVYSIEQINKENITSSTYHSFPFHYIFLLVDF